MHCTLWNSFVLVGGYIYLSVNITIMIYDIDSRDWKVVFDTTIVDISLSVDYDVNGFTKVLQYHSPFN
jgi:hypothetical protein